MSTGFASKQRLIGNFLLLMEILRLYFPLCYCPVLQGGGSSRKNLGAMAPGIRGEKGGLRLSPQKIFSPRPFGPKKAPYFSTEIGHLYTKKL